MHSTVATVVWNIKMKNLNWTAPKINIFIDFACQN